MTKIQPAALFLPYDIGQATIEPFRVIRSLSLRVVENDAERMTMSRPDAADAVPEIDAIRAASARHGTMMNRKYNAITLAKRHNDRPRLHPWPLFRHHE